MNSKLSLTMFAKKFTYLLKIGLVLLCLSFTVTSYAAPQKSSCKLSRTYRVAIIEFGPLSNTQTMIKNLLIKLIENNYLPEYKLEKEFRFDDPMSYKQRMVQDLSTRCIKFVDEGLYNANWDHETLKQMATKLKKRISNGEVDMVWALGSQAIDLIRSSNSKIPILGMMCSDPDKLNESEYSRYANTHVLIEKRLFTDFVRGCQNMYKHKTIGVLKDHNPHLENYLDYQRLLELCKEDQTELKVCEGTFFTPDSNLAHQEFSRCMQKLADDKVDAVYLSELASAPDLNHFYKQIKPLLQNKIFPYSYESYEQIDAGSLMGFYDADQDSRASYEYDVLDRYFHGDKLEKIPQSFTVPYSYAINMKTASILQWKPTFSMLVAVDKIFQTISSNQD